MIYPAIVVCVLLVTATAPGFAEDSKTDKLGKRTSVNRYVVGLGEIMTVTQMRHGKLWFAGNARNWRLAEYELDELEEGFDDVIKYHPALDGLPIASLLNAFTNQPVADLKDAIESKNDQRFSDAFSELTAACNSCHQAVNREYIVITTPSVSPVINQRYRVEGSG